MRTERRFGRSGPFTRRHVLSLIGASALAMTAAPCPVRAKSSVPSRGINIPRWFDREGGIAPTPTVLEKLRHSGFETVRLAIDGDIALAGTPSLRAIRQGIETLIDAGFAVLADLHPAAPLYAALRADPAAGGERVAAAWTVLRAVIADLPTDTVYAELLNEPPMPSADWLPLRNRLAEILRTACPDHTIVWGPAPDQGIWQLSDSPPLDDGRQIAAVHFYAPTAFTHQCQSWGASPLARVHDLPFPASRLTPAVEKTILALRSTGDLEAAELIEQQLTTDWTGAAVHAQFRQAADWSAAANCPVMLNEFGVLDFCVDATSRQAWTRAVRLAAEQNGIGWAWWELDQGFGLIADRTSTEGFDAAMLDALFGNGR
nr:cellulase family glycosylhydrolase [uncultured Shinella sp.]